MEKKFLIEKDNKHIKREKNQGFERKKIFNIYFMVCFFPVFQLKIQ